MNQVTQEDIIIGVGFALQKLPIKNTVEDLNAEKYNYLLRMKPRSVDMNDCNVQHVLIASSYE